jgi:beta-alanine--pyruvate transaminase
VITAFGRLGKAYGSQAFDITPDIITTAKGLTSGTVPMGAVFVQDGIYDAFMDGPGHAIELFHGYTYSAHPLAVAACIATQGVYREEGLFERSAEMAPKFEDALHSLKDEPYVIDVRNYGLMGAVELQGIDGKPGERGLDAMVRAFENGAMVRVTGDTLAFSPPLIIEEPHIEALVENIRSVLRSL